MAKQTYGWTCTCGASENGFRSARASDRDLERHGEERHSRVGFTATRSDGSGYQVKPETRLLRMH